MNRSVLALPLMLIPGISSADITPEDVWSNVQATYTAMGLEVTGDAMRTGETLTVTNGIVTLTYPIIGGQATITLPQLGLIDQGDGTVRVVMPDSYLSKVAADIPEEDDQISFEIAVSQSGFNSIASGDAGDVTYTTDVAKFDMIMNALDVPGEEVAFSLEFASEGYAGVTNVNEGDVLTITSDVENRPSTTSFSFAAQGMSQENTNNSDAMTTQATLVLPPDMNIMNLTPALMAGLSVKASMQTGPATGESRMTMDGELMSEQVQSTGPGIAEFGLDKDGFRLTAEVSGFDATINQADLLPFPIEINGEVFAGSFAFPLVANDAPQDFKYAFRMSGLEIAEGLWGMIDPGQGLDRSPIDLVFDVSGSLDWGLDVFDIPTLMTLDNGNADVPIAILSADINDVTMNMLGGSVNATGAFTFDNDDLATFDGMPRPEGTAKATATGLNAVIDQLIATGLLPEDQAGMGRMFMGMFAVSTGDDALETTVEINAEGHLMLNGQRMR